MSPMTLRHRGESEKRQTMRAEVDAKVRLQPSDGAGRCGEPMEGRATDLSRDGLYAIVEGAPALTPGHMVSAQVTVPWEWRQAVPCARISGWARVVRVDPVRTPAGAAATGIALAFCRDAIVLGSLGAS